MEIEVLWSQFKHCTLPAPIDGQSFQCTPGVVAMIDGKEHSLWMNDTRGETAMEALAKAEDAVEEFKRTKDLSMFPSYQTDR